MPELPEVETTRRGILPAIDGRTVRHVEVRNHSFRQAIPADLGLQLTGQRLLTVDRRAKYLLLRFAQGTLIIHLGMSGSLRVVQPGTPLQPHEHVDIDFDGQILRFRDPRRFGLVLWHTGPDEAHPLLSSLGIEPLSEAFDGRWLFRVSREVRTPVKQFLMDAKRLVGVGNIYASESLFHARIHPSTAAGTLGLTRCTRLVNAVRSTLEAALAAGGSTLRDFVHSDGSSGYFQQQYAVYGRTGEPCRICGTPVRKQIQGQRSTFYCAHCQRP